MAWPAAARTEAALGLAARGAISRNSARRPTKVPRPASLPVVAIVTSFARRAGVVVSCSVARSRATGYVSRQRLQLSPTRPTFEE